ncbi:hypothetical protein BKA70DRAFT_97632 [Coprinopsis sp. MPI-PUGE-AT-0042]|nr:hypothetical protein BKA70DRAFT_97632 [Coprinopsis sp. MPI-PUGE-AT-0042]
MPDEGDDCLLFYDSMHGVVEASIVWCEGCGNAVHKGCIAQCSNTARANGNAVTCVWCCSKWISPEAGGAGAGVRRTTKGYLNLGGVGGVSPVLDTSSYEYPSSTRFLPLSPFRSLYLSFVLPLLDASSFLVVLRLITICLCFIL